MTKTKTRSPAKTDTTARARIIAEARKRFASSGFDGASTRQIAEDAGVAQSLLLYHFGSKDVLWKAMMDDTFERARLIGLANGGRDSSAPPKEQLQASVRAFIQVCRDLPDLHRLMTIEGRTKSERLTWLAKKHLKPAFDASIDLIIRAQKDGIVKPGDPALIHYGIIAIAGMAYAFAPEISLMTGKKAKPDPVEVEKLVSDFLFTR